MKISEALVALATISSATVLGVNNSPVFSQNSSFVGCWKGTTTPSINGIAITDTHIFHKNGRYEGQRTGSPIASINGKWSGNWSQNQEGYVIVDSGPASKKWQFHLTSPNEMRTLSSATRFSRC